MEEKNIREEFSKILVDNLNDYSKILEFSSKTRKFKFVLFLNKKIKNSTNIFLIQ